VTGLLLRVARWTGPTMGRELIMRVRPATCELAEFAEDELTLTFLWASGVLVATILTVGLAAAGSRLSPRAGTTGLNTGTAIVAGCVAGAFLHTFRFVIAESASRLGEWRYRKLTGHSSGMAAAMGEDVREKPHPVLSLILRSTDLDLLAQLAVAIIVIAVAR
jgi:hypothetical protein